MSSVMIRCPVTGRAVSTQIETEPYVLRALPRIAARMNCSACGQEHVWATDEAWLDEEPLPQATEDQEAADIAGSEAA
ncbi:MAG: hypothetical protein WCI56_04890 [Hyphomicrobiales bacterium]